MKYFVFALFVCLCPVTVGLVEDGLDEGQVMSGEPQVSYLMKEQKHFEDKMALTSEYNKHRLMHPKFFIQKKNSVVQDQSSAVKVQHDNGEDIPK
ncbi:hypothetical protein GCK32_018093 [Trichostrongylus colubriformis]|uniref:Uncharacterized protein n=1 Tax=Trichostrongylus colubriformis TaxID=6319 RepID=A0AAN8FVZ4_TRICO